MKAFSFKLSSFWFAHPLLYFGLNAAFSISFFLTLDPSIQFLLGFLLLLIWSPFLIEKKWPWMVAGVFNLLLGFFLTAFVIIPDIPEEGLKGLAKVKINQLIEKNQQNRTWYQAKVTLLSFTPEGQTESVAHRIPCNLSLSKRPHGSCLELSATLKKGSGYTFFLKEQKGLPVQEEHDLLSFILRWRNQSQKWLKTLIEKKIQSTDAQETLKGLIFGGLESPHLKSTFQKFGLQHLLAVSGFHFSLMIALAAVLSRSLSQKRTLLFLFIVASVYLFLVGASFSVLRAWIMVSWMLMGEWLSTSNSSLNALGASLLIEECLEPFCLFDAGFQLSFLVTGSILLFYPYFHLHLRSLFCPYTRQELLSFTFIDQFFSLVLRFSSSGVALTMAVIMMALPLTLFHFHIFPWFSLFLNLFYPFLLSISLSLFLITLPFLWVPGIGDALFALNSIYTEQVLSWLLNTPAHLGLAWVTDALTPILALFILALICLLGIFAWKSARDKDVLVGFIP